MQIIETLTSYPNQLHQLVLDNGDTAEFRLYFSIRQLCWYFDLSYNGIIINGAKVVLSPNTLRQYKKILPFGIAFFSDGMAEPFQVTDFADGTIQMGILNAEEVEQLEREVFNYG